MRRRYAIPQSRKAAVSLNVSPRGRRRRKIVRIGLADLDIRAGAGLQVVDVGGRRVGSSLDGRVVTRRASPGSRAFQDLVEQLGRAGGDPPHASEGLGDHVPMAVVPRRRRVTLAVQELDVVDAPRRHHGIEADSTPLACLGDAVVVRLPQVVNADQKRLLMSRGSPVRSSSSALVEATAAEGMEALEEVIRGFHQGGRSGPSGHLRGTEQARTVAGGSPHIRRRGPGVPCPCHGPGARARPSPSGHVEDARQRGLLDEQVR